MTVRFDGRYARGIVVENYEECARMNPTTETAPAGGGTPNGSLTEPEWGSAMGQSTNRLEIARDYLTRARDDFENAARTRIWYVVLARRYGMTNADIGAHLGLSEGAVRALIKRHGDA